MAIIETVVQFVLDVISTLGYPGIVLLMTLESMCIPIPSEVVMPFSGWLAYDGRFDLLLVSLAGTLGCVIGSAIAYYIGFTGGREAVLRYVKYILLNKRHLDETERWFQKYGTVTVFITRLMPVVRTFISLPIGMARYPFTKFIILTAIASFIWCYLLAYIGYVLGPNWDQIESYFRGMDVVIIVGVILFVVWFLWRVRRSVIEEGEGQE
jgi:membrane protein DedA with SNARE-associated domain